MSEKTFKKLDWYQFGTLNPVSKNNDPGIDYDRLDSFEILNKTVRKASEQNVLNVVGYFKAIVLRDDTDLGKVDKSWSILSFFNTPLIQFKARIPELHAALPIPKNIETGKSLEERESTPERRHNNKIIEMYPTFTSPRDKGLDAPVPGMIVYVDFGNRDTMEEPFYMGPASDSPVVFGGVGGAKEVKAAVKPLRRTELKSMGDFTGYHQFTEKETAPIISSPSSPTDNKFITTYIRPKGNRLILRDDLLQPINKIVETIQQLGRINGPRSTKDENDLPVFFFSSGKRELDASVGVDHSMHKLGLALDLRASPTFFASSRSAHFRPVHLSKVMFYVTYRDNVISLPQGVRPSFDVWIRTDQPAGKDFNGVSIEARGEQNPLHVLDISRSYFKKKKPVIRKVKGNFISLTKIMSNSGFVPITARGSCTIHKDSNPAFSEWWHFENRMSISIGDTFGSHLARVYTISELEKSRVWNRVKDFAWRGTFFGKPR